LVYGFSLVGGYLMKSILVYGDSLVWGRNARQKDRHSFDDRWPNVLATSLKDLTVWEAGLGGRTTDLEFAGRPGRNGSQHLPVALLQAAPLDLVILALGTNDPFAEAGRKPQDTANAMRALIAAVRDLPSDPGSSVPNTNPPKVMIVSPPNCLPLSSVTGEGSPELDDLTRWLPELANLYGKLAIEQDTYFADAAKFCEPDPMDGLHLDVENNRKLGLGIARILALVDHIT
jgi:lysophospholipase L1-like esterase